MNTEFIAAAAAMMIAAASFVAFRLRSSAKDSRAPLLISLAVVPVVAIGFYAHLGNPGAAAAEKPVPVRVASDGEGRQQNALVPVASVASLVDGLVERLHKNPDDAGGWLLLAKSYRHLDRPADARLAYRRALELGRSDADLERYLAGLEPAGAGLAEVRAWLRESKP